MQAQAKITIGVILCAVVLVIASYVTKAEDSSLFPVLGETDSYQQAPEPVAAVYEQTRSFSNQEFSDLYNSLPLPNIAPIIGRQEIFGHIVADSKIASLAESRGYQLRHVAQTNLNSFDGHFLQEPVIQDWEGLAQAALADGVRLKIVSGHRSIEDQRELFIGRIQRAGLNVDQIASSDFDSKLDAVLQYASPPGYSRHHSGYTIDVGDEDQPYFTSSKGYAWLSADNFENAKKYGFIPSYPEDVSGQGPVPETWEFVWVGRNLTFISQ